LRRGLASFIAVGQAFLAVRNRKLYRVGYHNFEDYYERRWQIDTRYAYRLMDGAKVAENLANWPENESQPLPANEAQVRPLIGLPTHLQREVWAAAADTAPNGKVTAAHEPRHSGRSWCDDHVKAIVDGFLAAEAEKVDAALDEVVGVEKRRIDQAVAAFLDASTAISVLCGYKPAEFIDLLPPKRYQRLVETAAQFAA
jgi:hypothetical protein